MQKQGPKNNNQENAKSVENASTEKAHRELVAKVKSMTIQERIDSLVRSGILTEKGKLAPEYGG
jgi:hypothetical protein